MKPTPGAVLLLVALPNRTPHWGLRVDWSVALPRALGIVPRTSCGQLEGYGGAGQVRRVARRRDRCGKTVQKGWEPMRG